MCVAEAVIDFLKKYFGVFVVLQEVGARVLSPELRMMRVRGTWRFSRYERHTLLCASRVAQRFGRVMGERGR